MSWVTGIMIRAMTCTSYFYLITNYLNPVRLLDGVWSIRLIIISTGCMMIVSHLFYARRV
ncbi:hypothetical protein DICSQDRAFT_175104 [Dichomitus squalens LYAD-421 SS1]|uniref:Uncharacterized protein n=1 Tax=Dichomitus squalens (strain LYAD-421) TaxID=732165 RepID=R7SKH0_DICSQ|nr:uncharacterized protein DICSQDRAFT_175104 [Dichomitus squalens LYAD-421 SS1]EJF56205.1 hypothetical protein DICSQDRAFT_175104 [Dichomitus squalens LYAD-421 SS1]